MSRPMMVHGYADIQVEHDDGARTADVTDLVTQVQSTDDINTAYATLEVSLYNSVNGRDRRINFDNGDWLIFKNHGVEWFRGRIFNRDIDAELMETLTAYDTNAYLTKNEITRKFTKQTAGDILRRLCREFDLGVNAIDDTGYVIPKLSVENETLFSTFKKAIEKTEKQTGKRYVLYNFRGNVALREESFFTPGRVIEEGQSIMSANYSQSIEDMRGRLIMTGGEDDEYKERKTSQQHIDRYGLTTARESYSGSDVSRSEVRNAAAERFDELTQIDDEASIDALGMDAVRAGRRAYFREQSSGIVGLYRVTAHTHTYENGQHTMSLNVTRVGDLPAGV
ncbi:XkdQ/YqbQ family protein [Alkalicoccus chagannorensis]|uniref:XkdQ/YqbQ family protein n=1 Tax=Alkalicoccus chagannorensis TaxID=427072 RepID=UPI000478B417|nr:hypothetical protein [Alkalicoccus chagannorensis]